MGASNNYWEWVEAESIKIKSDGCTKAKDWCKKCCWEHDLAFYYAKDPRHAFICRDWDLADPITFAQANSMFAKCLPWYLRYRWLGVTLGSWGIWKRHRAKRLLDITPPTVL